MLSTSVKKLTIPVEIVITGCDCMVEWGRRKQLFKASVIGVGKFSAMASSTASQSVKFLVSPAKTQLVPSLI